MTGSILHKLGFTKKFYLGTFLGLTSFISAWIIWSYLPSEYQGLTFILVLFGILIPVLVFRSIKCPKCKNRFMWNYFNNSKTIPKGFSPFKSPSCPECRYNP